MDAVTNLDYEDLNFLLRRFNFEDIKSDSLHHLLKNLTAQAEPTFEDDHDKSWSDFYLPIEKESELITVPFNVTENLDSNNNNFTLGFPSHVSLLCVREEPKEWDKYDSSAEHKRAGEAWKPIFDEVISFIPTLKEKGEAALNVPFKIRHGKVKGKHVLEEVLSEEERFQIVKRYENRVAKDLSGISLCDYLKVAAVCYKAAFPERTKRLSPKEMYNIKSHSGYDIFPIKNKNSQKEFAGWLRNNQLGHAFWFAFRVANLRPKLSPKPHYLLTSSEFRNDDFEQAQTYIKFINALIDSQIPFEADLKEALDYLTGETEFSVNIGEYPIYHYNDTPEEREKVFLYVKWDPLKILNFK